MIASPDSGIHDGGRLDIFPNRKKRPVPLNLDKLPRLPGLDRLTYDENGHSKLRYTAIDPAVELFTCPCGKPECQIAPLRPLRDHIGLLLRAIVSAGQEELLPNYGRGDEPWPGVIYPLQMAASIEDVFADPSFTDDSQAGLMCNSAWDSDEEDREEASKYVAGLTIFNFIWMAFEAAIKETAESRYGRDKPAVRARKIFGDEAKSIDHIPSLTYLLRLARYFCLKTEPIVQEINSIEAKYDLKGAAAAAELGRIFRNYIVHGADPIPIYNMSGKWAFYRFYAVSRMLLVLIQCLALLRLKDGSMVIPLSPSLCREEERAHWFFSNLHLKDELWLEKGDSVAKDFE